MRSDQQAEQDGRDRADRVHPPLRRDAATDLEAQDGGSIEEPLEATLELEELGVETGTRRVSHSATLTQRKDEIMGFDLEGKLAALDHAIELLEDKAHTSVRLVQSYEARDELELATDEAARGTNAAMDAETLTRLRTDLMLERAARALVIAGEIAPESRRVDPRTS